MLDSQTGSKRHYTNNLKHTYKNTPVVNELQKEYAVQVQPVMTMVIIIMNTWTETIFTAHNGCLNITVYHFIS